MAAPIVLVSRRWGGGRGERGRAGAGLATKGAVRYGELPDREGGGRWGLRVGDAHVEQLFSRGLHACGRIRPVLGAGLQDLETRVERSDVVDDRVVVGVGAEETTVEVSLREASSSERGEGREGGIGVGDGGEAGMGSVKGGQGSYLDASDAAVGDARGEARGVVGLVVRAHFARGRRVVHLPGRRAHWEDAERRLRVRMPVLLLVGGGLLLSHLVGGNKLLAPVELLDGGLAKLPNACTRTKVR